MNAVVTTAVVAASLLGALLLGIRLRPLLPSHHLASDSKDAVKLAMGLVATMTALLLGLLVSSAKGTFDTQRSEVAQLAAKVAFLDRVLSLYGPDAAEIRSELRSLVAEAVRRMWPDEPGLAGDAQVDERGGDALFLDLQRLSPHDDLQRSLKAQAITLTVDLGELRTLLLIQSIPSISAPLLVTVVCWLVVIFVGFATLAPTNTTTTVALVAAAVSVIGAVFLILELDQPLGGIIRISSAPMVNALAHLVK